MIAFCEETNPSGRVLPNVLDVLPGTELFAREQEFFSGQPSLAQADITRVQIELLLDFYKTNFDIDELFRVIPPNIVIE